MDEEKTYEEELEENLNFIERRANDLSEPIIDKMAKSVIKRMNDKLGRLIRDDYSELGCNKFFDMYSIDIQTMYTDEIHPGLSDVIFDWISLAHDNLNPIDKFIMDCSTLSEELNHDDTFTPIYRRVSKRLSELAYKHYLTQRIQKITDKLDWF